jgi:hypothetical protein
MSRAPSRLFLAALLALTGLASACSERRTEAGVELADAPLSPMRARLLDVAFEAASAMPLAPHVKNRSRAQDAVLVAALELEQSVRALHYAERIENWRRGAGMADVAYVAARRGARSVAERCLAEATAVAADPPNEERPDGGDGQAWRRDRILAKVARAQLELGDEAAAYALAAELEASERGTVEAALSARAATDAFDERLCALDALVASGDFDRILGALAGYGALLERVYADPARRGEVEQRVEGALAKLPLDVRVRNALERAETALAHDDAPAALALAARAREWLVATPFAADLHLPLHAELAALRFRAGEPGEARAELGAARLAYGRERATLVDVTRAGVLRPLAEAAQVIGDASAARELYAQALAEGVLNPNSRPRAEDLVATLVSMAVRGFEPDAELWARIEAIRAGLGDPW